jgi:large subunit ribosomal protein L18Ae
VGRHKPTPKDPNPKIYRMCLFATNDVVAKARFWHYLRTLRKIKHSHGELLGIYKVEERNPRIVKNYGIWLRYQSRYNHHNLYKEYRDVSRTGAVNQMYSDMAGQYHATFRSIQIVDIKEVDAKNCRRENTKQFHNSKIRFPLPHRVLRAPSLKYRSTFKAHRPTTHFG